MFKKISTHRTSSNFKISYYFINSWLISKRLCKIFFLFFFYNIGFETFIYFFFFLDFVRYTEQSAYIHTYTHTYIYIYMCVYSYMYLHKCKRILLYQHYDLNILYRTRFTYVQFVHIYRTLLRYDPRGNEMEYVKRNENDITATHNIKITKLCIFIS